MSLLIHRKSLSVCVVTLLIRELSLGVCREVDVFLDLELRLS